MRTKNLLSLGLTCVLAGAATFQGQKQQQSGPVKPKVGETPQSSSAKDEPYFRMDCDEWDRLRPTNESIWQKMTEADLTVEEAISLALEYAKEDRKFPNVRLSKAQFVPSEKPFFDIELFTYNEANDRVLRWQVYVGVKTRQVKRWMVQERFPGTPIRVPLRETDSGILMADIREGDGLEVTPESTVKIHYVGSILDGTVVFNTYTNRSPETYPLTKAPLKGMVEGLVGARAGGKRKLILPPELAYGEAGAGGVIPPNAVVVVDVEILKVE
jgi:hypothetical protein